MLAGDNGSSNIDPYAEGPTDDNQWVVEGPHRGVHKQVSESHSGLQLSLLTRETDRRRLVWFSSQP
jgi:hypothetical protein